MKSSMSKKYIIKNAIDLANPILGTKIINCSDEFFAPATRIINPLPAIFKENVFDIHGKWMDGWETRRRRSGGNDYLIIKLGKPGKIQLVDIDTTYFNGNQPEYAQLEGCFSKNNFFFLYTCLIGNPSKNSFPKKITGPQFISFIFLIHLTFLFLIFTF